MFFVKENIYHIYNRSNETVFYSDGNYLFFLQKVNTLLKPVCEILSWCLMPNHFHFLIQATDISEKYIEEKHRKSTQILSKNIGILLSAYTQAINKQQGRKGKLWAHDTKAKQITGGSDNYGLQCLHYIHQNPLRAGLVKDLNLWKYSSYPDYMDFRQGKLVNKQLSLELFHISKDDLKEQSQYLIEKNISEKFY